MKHLELIKFTVGLFLLSLPVITGLLFFYGLFTTDWLSIFSNYGILRFEISPKVTSTTLIFVSACGFIGAYLLNSIKSIN